MPYQFKLTSGSGLRAAPNVVVAAGDLSFTLLDSSGAPVTGADVEFHVLFGDGTFLVPGTYGDVAAVVATAQTDTAGLVRAPKFQLGPAPGPNGVLVQSPHASFEAVVMGSYDTTVLKVLSPQPPANIVAGETCNLQIVAQDSGYNSAPVPDLPVEIEVLSGAATFAAGDGVGHYDLRPTSFDGTIGFELQLGHRAPEHVEVRFTPYWQPKIAPVSVAFDVNAPNILAYSFNTLPDCQLRSVMEPIRPEISRTTSLPMLPGDKNVIMFMFGYAEDKNDIVDVHPAASDLVYETKSFLLWPKQQGTIDVELRLPDYPDAAHYHTAGRVVEPLDGAVPVVNDPGPAHTDYVHTVGGGDEDTSHLIRASVDGSGIRYLGPNHVTDTPFTIHVDVTAPTSPRRLVQAKFKAKVHDSPANSMLDDSNSTDVPPGIATSSGGPFADELEVDVDGAPGPHSFTLFCKESEWGYDAVIDVTAKVTMEDVDANGNLYQFDEDSTLQVRCAVVRPRVTLVRKVGNDFVPITESGVRPVSLIGRDGTQATPPDDCAFYVEARCHDLSPGATVTPLGCTLGSGDQADLQLDRVDVKPEYALYRSHACWLYVDDDASGGPPPTVPQGVTYLRAGTFVVAVIDKQMPDNTSQPQQVYSSARRPVTWLGFVGVGDASAVDVLAPPSLDIDLGADLTWSASVSGTSPRVTVSGTVRDVFADLGLGQPQHVEIAGSRYSLTAATETNTFGRPSAWSATFSQAVNVEFGVQLVTIAVQNALGARRERTYRVEVTEATNNVKSPASVTARVRPLPGQPPPQLPFLQYLYASGTYLGDGVTPPTTVAAQVTPLDVFPGTGGTAIAMTLRQRPSAATDYVSDVFVSPRADLVPAGVAGPALVAVPKGGRLDWSSSDLPNILGSLTLSNRRERPIQLTTLQRKNASGAWEDATFVRTGDILTVKATRFPRQTGGTEAFIGFRDATSRGVGGEGRVLRLELTETTPGNYELAKYADKPTAPAQPATQIAVLADGDDVPAGLAPLRIVGSGRVIAGATLSPIGGASVPAFVRPDRFQRSGTPVDQEGFRPGVRRIGALETVVPGTGEVVLGAFDRHIPGRGLAVDLGRTYRSANLYPGPLGHGWNASWNVFLWREADDEVHILQGDGLIAIFKRSAGEWQPPPGMYGTLAEERGCWTLRTPAGIVLTFARVAEGVQRVFPLAAFEDRFGNRLRYRYPSHGRLAMIVDTLDRTIQLRHDAPTGRLTLVGDFTGCDIRYDRYGAGDPDGAEGNLKSVRSPIVTNPDNPFPDGRLEGYGYDTSANQHRLRWLQDGAGNAGSLDKLLQVDYDGDGHVQTQKYGDGSFTFAPGATWLSWADRKNNQRRIEFDFAGSGGMARRPSRVICVRAGNDLTHAYLYNSQGEITTHTWPLGNATTTTFDDAAADPRDRGNVLEQKKLPDGARSAEVTRTVGATSFDTDPTPTTPTELKESFTYVPGLQLVDTYTDAMGRVTKHVYDDVFPTKVTDPTVTAGGLGGAAQPREQTTVWSRYGQLLRESDPTGVVTRFSYYPVDDPTGAGGGTPVSDVGTPGGYLAMIEHDVADPLVARSSGLAPIRTVKETFTYDDRGNVVLHVDGRSMNTSLEWNELNELTRVVGPELEETIHRYDDDGRVKETLHTIGDISFPTDVTPLPNVQTRDVTTFDRLGRLVLSTIDADALSLTSRLMYDANDNLEYEYSPLTIRPNNPRPNNLVHSYYDDLDRRVKEVHGEGSGAELVREWAYDDNGDVTRESYGGLWGRWIDRDAFGRVIARRDDVGGTVETHLDEAGNATRLVMRGSYDGDPTHVAVLQEVIRYIDEADRCVAVREKAYYLEPVAAGGYSTTQVGNGKRMTLYAYDARGRQVRTTNPLGLVTTLTVDAYGLPTHTDDGQGQTTDVTYDGQNNPALIAATDGIGQTTITRTYDNSGRPILETAGGKTTQQIWYDTMGRPRMREDAMGNRVEVRYDGAGRTIGTVHRTYDKGCRVNEDGSVNALRDTLRTKNVYDDNGNLIEAYDAFLNLIEKFDYDDRNVICARTTGEDSFTYGGKKRDENPGPETTTYTYRPDGNVDTVTDAEGHTITMKYDDAGRVTGRTIAQGAAASLYGTTGESYTWDGLGRLLQATDDNGVLGGVATVMQRYTSCGEARWARQEQNWTGAPAVEIQAAYDEGGRRQLLTYPTGGRSVRTAVNGFGLTERVTEGTSNQSYAEYGYVGRYFSHRIYPNGLTYGYGYNSSKQVQEIRTYRGTNFLDPANLVTGHRYVYNAAGLPVRDQDLEKNAVSNLYYDSLYRQTATVNGFDPNDPNSIPTDGSWTTFDWNGNPYKTEGGPVKDRQPDGRLIVIDANESWANFNEVNEMGSKQQVVKAPGKPPVTRRQTFHYDRRGNLVSDGRHDYHYDYKNRLVAIEPHSGSGTKHRFYYDALDRRVRKDDTHFAWWLNDVVEAYHDSGSWFMRFIYGALGGELVAYETNSTGTQATYWVHGSRNGTTEFLTDLSGEIVERYGYDPFGTPTVEDKDGKPQPAVNRTELPFLMHNQWYDAEVDLYSVGSRSYYPFLGRFVQRDPNGALDDPLARGNAYTFSGNNPAAFMDSSGQAGEWAEGATEFGKTVAEGGAIIGGLAFLSCCGPIGAALAGIIAIGLLVGMVVAACVAIYSRCEEVSWAGGGAKGYALAVVGGFGDVLGFSGAIEACMGRRMDSNLPLGLSTVERARLAGRSAGQIALLLAGPKAFKFARARFLAIRQMGGPVRVDMMASRMGGGRFAKVGAHTILRYVDAAARKVTVIERWPEVEGPPKRPNVERSVYEYSSADRLAEFLRHHDEIYQTRASYETPRSAIDAAEARIADVSEVKGHKMVFQNDVADGYLQGYRKPFKQCSTLPGELGMGIYTPLFPTHAVIVNGLYMSGWIPTGVALVATRMNQ